MDVIIRTTDDSRTQFSSVLDICRADICKMEKSVEIVIGVIYIVEKQEMADISEFVLRALSEYWINSSEIYKEDQRRETTNYWWFFIGIFG